MFADFKFHNAKEGSSSGGLFHYLEKENQGRIIENQNLVLEGKEIIIDASKSYDEYITIISPNLLDYKISYNWECIPPLNKYCSEIKDNKL